MAKLIVTAQYTAEANEDIETSQTLASIQTRAATLARKAGPDGAKVQSYRWRVEDGDEVLAGGTKYLNE